ncbi:fatty acid desaturase [Mycolicibacterium sp.]|uniref:fatty acid desaturase n=1 Tax=Mycolicibacterium sp. TaxID=2320850 RepID=UPI0028A6EEAB|nr:fatty acid desaturase [Mycolicibacterium sp.]
MPSSASVVVTPGSAESSSASGLADELQALYDETRAAMGAADLAHIRTVTAYGQAINARRLELLADGGPRAMGRAAVLETLYRLLQFSELGHNVLHGTYDDLPGNGDFHSDRYVWDFNVDPAQWKVMHHEGHHPNTNIVGKDHDLGYSVLRGQAGQDWFGHHAIQLLLFTAVSPFFTQLAPFLIANITRQVEGKRFWSRETLRAPARIALADTKRRLLTEPLSMGPRFLPAAAVNQIGGVAGYLAVLFLVAIEHHAGETEVFTDPGPDETRDDYYRRQVRATRNFLRSAKLDAALQRILEDEVPFENRPDFQIFYGGLDTHIEHHLFPDLPPNRQREIAPRVKEIVTRHGLPYHQTPLGETAALMLKALTGLSIPVGEREAGHPLMLLKRPAGLARRVASGMRYRALPEAPYLDKPRWYNVPVRVVATEALAGGNARLIRLEKPRGWDDVCWDPGAFVSLCVPDGDETLIRQYSLLQDSTGSETMDICVKRMPGGRVSTALNDDLRAGDYLTVLRPPVSSGGLATPDVPSRALFIAGGVGITPIISLLRSLARTAQPRDAVLLYFNRDGASILFEQEIAELAELAGIDVHVFRGRRPSPDLLAALVPDSCDRETFVCAPSGLVESVRGYLTALGAAPELFHTESFAAPERRRPADDGSRYLVSFARSRRTVEIDGNTTLLEAANRVGIRVPTGCRSGLCRACVTPKLSGSVQREVGGRSMERITVCDSVACSDIELDL